MFLAIGFGGFASIAQNDYGLKVISWSCFAFSFTILMELIFANRELSILKKVEHIGLVFLMALFGLRAAYIHFPYVEWVVVGTAITLAAIYLMSGLSNYNSIKSSNRLMALMVMVYYLSLVAFLGSVFLRPIFTPLSFASGGVGGLFMGIFIIAVVFKRKQLVEGQETNMLDFVRSRGDHSPILLTGFLLISMYTGLNLIGVLPPLYTQEVPQEYIELVNKAETGKEKAVDGKYQYDAYKEALDKFLERHEEVNE